MPTTPASIPVRAASVGANITLSGTQTVDGVALAAGERFFAKDQSTPSQNGAYRVAAGAWTRTYDMPTGLILVGSHEVNVAEGTANADTTWMCTTDGVITIGTTGTAYKRVDGAWDEWKDLAGPYAAVLASLAAGGIWRLRMDGGTPLISTAALVGADAVFPLDPAQYAVTGKTVQVRIAAQIITSSTAPAITFTFRLYPINSVAAFVPTLGAGVGDAVITTPALNTQTAAYGAALTMPAAGSYVMGVLTSGTNASITEQMRAALQIRAI